MFNCCYGKHERILTCCWDYLGGGGDALAKFEPKDVPTMSMTITSVGSNSNACASLNIIWHRNRIELNFTSFLSRIKQSDMFYETFLPIFYQLDFHFFNIFQYFIFAICSAGNLYLFRYLFVYRNSVIYFLNLKDFNNL